MSWRPLHGKGMFAWSCTGLHPQLPAGDLLSPVVLLTPPSKKNKKIHSAQIICGTPNMCCGTLIEHDHTRGLACFSPCGTCTCPGGPPQASHLIATRTVSLSSSSPQHTLLGTYHCPTGSAAAALLGACLWTAHKFLCVTEK